MAIHQVGFGTARRTIQHPLAQLSRRVTSVAPLFTEGLFLGQNRYRTKVELTLLVKTVVTRQNRQII
jgi:hypothetical protein